MVFIMTSRRAMGKRHDQISADILDIEGRPVLIEARVAESAVIVGAQQVETGVEDLDPPRLEVGRVKYRSAANLCNGAPFVHCFASAILENDGIGRVHGGIPARNRAILGHEQEEGLGAGAYQKSSRRIEDGS